MVIEVNIAANYFVGLREGGWFVAVDTFCFENREEIFCHCIVIWVSSSWHRRRNAVYLSQLKICLRGVLNTLVAVEFQFLSVLLFYLLHSKTNGIQNQICGSHKHPNIAYAARQ